MKSNRVKWVIIAPIAVVLTSFFFAWVLPQAALWEAKREALAKFNKQSQDNFDLVLSPQIKTITPATPEPQTVWREVDGYRFSLPASKYITLVSQGHPLASDKMMVTFMGKIPPKDMFGESQAAVDGYERFFKGEDPYDVLVETFNATTAGIQDQPDMWDLKRYLVLLMYKAELAPIGSEKFWMRFETGKYKGIIAGDIAGDTSRKGIFVTLYLPQTRYFVEAAITPKAGATMDDVWRMFSELQIEKK